MWKKSINCSNASEFYDRKIEEITELNEKVKIIKCSRIASSQKEEFLERIKNPAASDLLKVICQFISDFNSSTESDDSVKSKIVQGFYAEIAKEVERHPLWSKSNAELLRVTLEDIEKYVMCKIYDQAFSSKTDDSLDDSLRSRIQLLNGMKLEFLLGKEAENAILPNFIMDTIIKNCGKELMKLNVFKSPVEKLAVLTKSTKILVENLSAKIPNVNADVLMPFTVFLLIKINPFKIISNLSYIQRYRNQSLFDGEDGYYFTNILAAIEFIQSLDPSDFGLEVAARVKRTEDFSFASNILNRVDSVKDAISYFYDFSKRNAKKKPVESDYKYWSSSFDDLKITELRELFAEYQKLIKENVELKKKIYSS